MTADVDLFLPGWDIEPCDTATPTPPTRGGHGNPCANVPDEPQDHRTTVTHHHPEICCDRTRAH